MKMILQVLSGTDTGRRIWLRCGETIEVGRTQRAEFVISDDGQMSSLHFSLTCEPHACRLRDLDSTNGTFLNGAKTAAAAVRDGDEITAGQTRFAVLLQHDQPAASRHDPSVVSQPPSSTSRPTSSSMDHSAADDEPLADQTQDDDDRPATGQSEPPPVSRPSVAPPVVAPPPPPDQPNVPTPLVSPPLERVVLEMQSSGTSGRRVWLRTGQVLQVGRTEEADFVVADDPQMSGVHFALQCGRAVCRLVDHDSDGGTFVNGKQVAEAPLKNGDQITAGRTSFVVRIMGGAPAATSPPLEGKPLASHPSVISAAVAVRPPTYVPQPCLSGLSSFRDVGPPQDPVSIAGRLAQEFSLFLVIDFHKLKIPPPTEPARVDYLYDWLPPEAAAQASPIVLSADECDECFSLVKKGWGKDSLICVYTRQDKAALLGHLRSLARHKTSSDVETSVEDAVVAFCWPRIVSALLANTTTEQAEHLMSAVEAVLMEVDSPESWQIFGKPDLTVTLDRLGFVRAASEDDSSEGSADN